MKRLALILMLMIVSITTFAQVYKLQTTEISIKTKNDYGNWGNWSEWEDCSCLVVVNLDKEKIQIFSKEPQEYDIYDSDALYTDSDGDDVLKMKAVDQDGDKCTVRIIFRKKGQAQLYVDFNDIMWVYNIQPK